MDKPVDALSKPDVINTPEAIHPTTLEHVGAITIPETPSIVPKPSCNTPSARVVMLYSLFLLVA